MILFLLDNFIFRLRALQISTCLIESRGLAKSPQKPAINVCIWMIFLGIWLGSKEDFDIFF